MSVCSSGKVPYVSRRQAANAAKTIARARPKSTANRGGEMRPYRCKWCGDWHLTSQGRNGKHR